MKILHLEDCQNDAILIETVLREEWPDCNIDLVDTREEFAACVGTQPYEIILSDFTGLGFDGLTALGIAREAAPDTPFVFLSGTIGEDRAIAAMRNGAADYVLKDRPKRLVPAIRRALADAAHVRAKRTAEAQLLHVQRLQNIGMLAAGIAHDFNNVLAPVLMGIPLLHDHVADAGMRQILSNMEISVRRGASLVQQILGFANESAGQSPVVQPKHVLRELVALMHQTFPKHIEIAECFEPDLWPVRASPTHLHQLFLNLCVNARDAMAAGGTLQFAARNQELDASAARAIPGAREGRHVVFTVADTGTGISTENQARIWEPFFTTKPPDRGTGLGLPIVRRIVENHGGTLTLHSVVGRGTTFRIYLPAAEIAEPRRPTAVGPMAPGGSGELILIVDDDPVVRSVTTAVLEKHGYRTRCASNGIEAMEIVTGAVTKIDVVITDLGMRHLDGLALAKAVRSRNKSARLLAISGMTDAEEQLRLHDLPVPFLIKPFTAEALLSAVHALLSEERAGPST